MNIFVEKHLRGVSGLGRCRCQRAGRDDRVRGGDLCSGKGLKSSVRPGAAGFTLIELLTVVAIIGILAAILIPVTGRVRESARRSQCQSNIRQQLIAMHLFAQDRAGQPIGEEAPSGAKAENVGFWYVLEASDDNAPLDLYPDYSDEPDIFICPSTSNRIRREEMDRGGRLTDLVRGAKDREDDRGGHSYEYLGLFGTRELAGVPKTPTTVSGIETQVMLVFDGDLAGLHNCPDDINNHGADGWNWGFADGHVEWVSRARTNEVSERSYHSANNCP